MKKLVLWLFCLATLLYCATSLEAASPIITPFVIGSTNKVEQYAAFQSEAIQVVLFQKAPDGHNYGAGSVLIEDIFNNKHELDAVYQEAIYAAASQAATNDDPDFNRSMPYVVVGISDRVVTSTDFSFISTAVLFVSGLPEVQLAKNYDGTYSAPSDLSGYKMRLSNFIPYEIKELEWARVEEYSMTNDALVQVYDSRFTNNVRMDILHNQVYLGVELATSALDGPFWPIIHTVSGTNEHTFNTYGKLGVEAKGTPTVITQIEKTGSKNSFKLTVQGSEVGRVVVAQSAPNIDGPWTVTSQTNAVISTNTVKLTVFATNSENYFRICTTNCIPW